MINQQCNFSPGATHKELHSNSQLVNFCALSLLLMLGMINGICFVHMFVILLLVIMCPIPKGLDHLNRSIYSLEETLDEFDNCDYVNDQILASINDLCIVQLNV